MCYYGTAQYQQAVPHLKAAVAKTSDNLQLRTVLAHSCLWSAHYDCALEQYRQILAIAPESAQADMLAGEALDGMHDPDGAIRQFEAAVKASPNEPNVHFGLGYLLWKQRSFDAAETQFKLELANDPNHTQALAYLADIEIKQNDNAAAQPLLEKAAGQPGAPRIAFVDLGVLLADQGHKEDAIAAFQRAIQMDPQQVDAHWRLARLYASMGRQQEAKAEFSKANDLHKQQDEPLATRMAAPRAN
jgi:tetratricopeptide (TPR) repeat protein